MIGRLPETSAQVADPMLPVHFSDRKSANALGRALRVPGQTGTVLRRVTPVRLLRYLPTETTRGNCSPAAHLPGALLYLLWERSLRERPNRQGSVGRQPRPHNSFVVHLPERAGVGRPRRPALRPSRRRMADSLLGGRL